jgi:hypothetical protein
MRHLQRDIAPHRQLPLPLNRGIPGISPISLVSRIVARQAGSRGADRVANMNPSRIIDAGIQAEEHVMPGAVKPERQLFYDGQLFLRRMRTGMEASAPEPAHGAQGRQPDRNVQVITDMQQESVDEGYEGYVPRQARSVVLARRSVSHVPNAPVSPQIHETHEANNGDVDAESITGKAASGNAGVPDGPATGPPTFELGEAPSDSLKLPGVVPASLSRAVQRQAAAQGFPHDHDFPGAHEARMSFPLQSRPGGSAVRSSRMDARSRIVRSPVAEQAAAPMIKQLGNRNGNSTRADFPIKHAAPAGMLRAADRADRSGRVARASGMAPAVSGGGDGRKEEDFFARTPGLERPALSAGGTGVVGRRLSLSQSSSPAGSRFLSTGISGRELLTAGPERLPDTYSSTTGEWQSRDATLRRAAIASPATVSGPGSVRIAAIHARAAVDGES